MTQDSLFDEYDQSHLDEAAAKAAEYARQQARESAERIRRAAEQRDGLVARTGSTDTQRAGAKAARPKSGTKRAKVFEAILSAGEAGITDSDLEMLLMERHPNEAGNWSKWGSSRTRGSAGSSHPGRRRSSGGSRHERRRPSTTPRRGAAMDQ
jgi:hypothetical protein